MREIKFRGQTPNGDWVYGDLTHCNGDVFVGDKRVEEESVEQYAYTDENGEEHYEGDTCRRHGGRIFRVAVLPYFEELFGGDDAILEVIK